MNSKRKVYILDTNVHLTNPKAVYLFKDNDIIIPTKVLEEIDNHKKRMDTVGANARAFCRTLDELRSFGNLYDGVTIEETDGFIQISSMKSNGDILPQEFDRGVPDNQILAVALQEREKNSDKKVVVVSCDINMRLKCDSVNLCAEDFQENQVITSGVELFSGVKNILVPDNIVDLIYSNEDVMPQELGSDLELFPNQILILTSDFDEKRKAFAIFVSHFLPIKKMKNYDNNNWGFVPKNKEQQFALNLLMNPDVPVVSLVGKAGSGKTITAIAAGLMQTINKDPIYSRLIVSRPVIPLGKDLGYLPGTKTEKIIPWLDPVLDNLRFLFGNDEGTLEEYQKQKLIELEALTYIRGRSIQNAFILIDECFPYDTRIDTSDGKYRIGNLFQKWIKEEDLPLVNSFNEKSKEFEYKKITNMWHRGKKPLVEITACLRKIKCTEDHPFLTDEGWKKASELEYGDLIACSHPEDHHINMPVSDDVEQLLIGSYLGDGSVEQVGLNSIRLSLNHGVQQKGYCEWKAGMLKCDAKEITGIGYNPEEPSIVAQSKSFSYRGEFDRPKVECPQFVLDKLNVKGLAIWFMDDGSVTKDGYGARIHTESFSEESVDAMVVMLEAKFQIKSKKLFAENKPYISIGRSSYLRLSELIASYVHPDLDYKVDVSYRSKVGEMKWINEDFEYGFIAFKSILSTGEVKHVFDMEVEDNHNFVIPSQSGGVNSRNSGVIAHNCQNLTRHEIKTILTRVGFNSKIILTGDIEQIDNLSLDETTNGLTYLIEKFKLQEIAGHITLLKGERSRTATVAANLL